MSEDDEAFYWYCFNCKKCRTAIDDLSTGICDETKKIVRALDSCEEFSVNTQHNEEEINFILGRREKALNKKWIKTRQYVAELEKQSSAILKNPDLFNLITVDELDKKIEGEVKNRQTIFLNACGMFVGNSNIASYNLCINSESGAGKDYVVKWVLKIFPKDKIVRRTRISPTVFNYWHNSRYEPDWTWNGKVCYLSDISNNILNNEVFKVMVSDGSLVTITINQRAIDIEIIGKPVMFITTAGAAPSSEMLRRFPILNLTETVEQTKAIMKRKAQAASKGITLEYEEKITKALSCLEQVNVKVPFADLLVNHFPPDHIIMRTHFDRLLDLIKASAALYQHQRKKDADGYILAEGSDFDRARIAIIQTTSNKLMRPLTKRQKEFLNLCQDLCDKHGWISVRYDILPKVDFDESQLYRLISRLIDFFETDSQKATAFFEGRDSLNEEQARRIYKPLKILKLKNYGELKIPTFNEIVAGK